MGASYRRSGNPKGFVFKFVGRRLSDSEILSYFAGFEFIPSWPRDPAPAMRDFTSIKNKLKCSTGGPIIYKGIQLNKLNPFFISLLKLPG
jgi:hypothetical protein